MGRGGQPAQRRPRDRRRTQARLKRVFAGGPTGKVARNLAEAMRKYMNNQTLVIENVGGAGGTLGANKVAKPNNDGYTLLLHHTGMATSPLRPDSSSAKTRWAR